MAIQYVGGITAGVNGSTTTGATLSLTSLTGGIDTIARTGDIVIVIVASTSQEDQPIGISAPTGYSEIAELYGDDTYKTNFSINWKIMGATPDTYVTTEPSHNAAYGLSAIAYVWRGVHQTTPLDVTSTTATGANTGQPTPPAITPVTSGSIIICSGAYGLTSGNLFTTATLSNFLSVIGNDNYVSTSGIGSYAWTSGEYTPATFGGGSTSTSASWASATIVLRPAVLLYTLTTEVTNFTLTTKDVSIHWIIKFITESTQFILNTFSVLININRWKGTNKNTSSFSSSSKNNSIWDNVDKSSSGSITNTFKNQ